MDACAPQGAPNQLVSYELCLMSYLMSYIILSSYDLTALVYVLLLGLRLTI